MHIGIDCRLAGLRHAGIGRYIQNLVRELIAQPSDTHWTFFFSDREQAEEVLGDATAHPKVRIVYVPVQHYTLAEQLQLPRAFAAAKLDLLHVPHFNVPLFYSGKFVVTIHDLLWHEQRGKNVTTLSPAKYWIKYLFYRVVTRHAVEKALKILVPATTVKETVQQLYPSTEQKLVVTKEGAKILPVDGFNQVSDTTLLAENPELKAVLQRTPMTFLYVGSLYPHKNITLVLQALEQNPDMSLVCVGARNVFKSAVQQEVHERGIQDRVHFLGFLDDRAVAALMRKVTALVQPSLSEGFGLTGVEAMQLGTPVLASDIPIFREIYQDGALYFDPHSSSSFAEAAKALQDTTQREERTKKAKLIAAWYSWENMAKQTLAVYHDAYSMLREPA